MKSLRALKRLFAIILVSTLALLSFAACSPKSPNLDLSQDDPFYTPSETTAAEPSSADSSSEQDSDTDYTDTETETAIDVTETDSEPDYETDPETEETVKDDSEISE